VTANTVNSIAAVANLELLVVMIYCI
jgi:hypothetical protein